MNESPSSDSGHSRGYRLGSQWAPSLGRFPSTLHFFCFTIKLSGQSMEIYLSLWSVVLFTPFQGLPRNVEESRRGAPPFSSQSRDRGVESDPIPTSSTEHPINLHQRPTPRLNSGPETSPVHLVVTEFLFGVVATGHVGPAGHAGRFGGVEWTLASLASRPPR